MSIPPIIIPEQQFCDADGHPYAGGSLATYIPDTSTPKQTWVDPDQSAANTNPVILDAAGRCILYGDGEYRLILRDAAGNEIWDIQATTLVSAAMAPVIASPTLAAARDALGVTAAINAEALARATADSTETSARIAADSTEATNRANADTALSNAISTETTNRANADTALQAQITALTPGGGGAGLIVKGGMGTLATTLPTPGQIHISFAAPFPTACLAMTVTCGDPVSGLHVDATFNVKNLTVNGADVAAWEAGAFMSTPQTFYWIAVGS